jgi:hypothetical protein
MKSRKKFAERRITNLGTSSPSFLSAVMMTAQVRLPKGCKMSELKCPFCNRELHKDSNGYYTCYTDNCGCWANGGNGASGSESLWLTLIRTRKALELAITGLKNCKTRDHIGAICRTPEYVDKVLEQITALEQKDVKC